MACASIHSWAAPHLYQIRKGYRAQWHDLTFSVEASSTQWTLTVRDSARVLYTAHRATVTAAQAAAAEFGIFRFFGACNSDAPVALARSLAWTEYW